MLADAALVAMKKQGNSNQEKLPTTSNLTVGSYWILSEKLLNPIGICLKLSESLVSDSDWKLLGVGMVLYPVRILRFRLFPTSDNSLSESDIKDSDEFLSDPMR